MSHANGISGVSPQRSMIAMINKNDAAGIKSRSGKGSSSKTEYDMTSTSGTLHGGTKNKKNSSSHGSSGNAKGSKVDKTV